MDILNKYNYSEADKLVILERIIKFICYFSMFKDIVPFMKSLHSCIKKTLEVKLDSIDDLKKLLISNALLRFISEYINYSKMNQKDAVLTYLAESLEKLKLQPLIVNLGLLIKPMYKDQHYLDKLTSIDDSEVVYVFNSDNEIKIKKRIDAWFDTQAICLENQEEIRVKLIQEFDRINMTDARKISRASESYQKLLSEILEMFSLKLTVVSLMDSISEESLEPLPIK
ncbi:MAG: hypothetical protein JW891_01755 [Candidatus Lokiarchaeota archaeon]|nr:hypothetical protein [Candidatus Lokiarchaeota archaeon]